MPVSSPIQEKVTPDTDVILPKRRWLAGFLSIILWQCVALLFVEAVLFWAGLGEEEIFKLDPQLGFRHMHNKRITYRSEGYSQSYFDERGFREQGITVEKPADTYRIALLGDSMVEGLQVPLENTFGQELEHRLNKICNRKVQVINFGVSGYSTTQEYLFLKNDVVKYHPDLVLLSYSTRDIFENWSPPDQTLTNVRPLALQLPGQKLVVNSDSVKVWMKTPRARFLLAIDWFRNNSRIWGLLSQADIDLSMHNPIYRSIIDFITDPKTNLKNWTAAIRTAISPKNTYLVAQSLPIKPISARSQSPSEPKQSLQQSQSTPAPKENSIDLSDIEPGISPQRLNYIKLMVRTQASLLSEMKAECKKVGAQFVVNMMLCRSQLCPFPGMEVTCSGFSYAQELKIMHRICQQEHIDLIDCETPAIKLPKEDRTKLFYSVHLTPAGHQFVSANLVPYLVDKLGSKY